jgi:glycosyltransferase involved in cell wall biosynthesis
MERGHCVDVVSAGVKGAWWDRVAQNGLGAWHIAETESFCPMSHAVKVCHFLRSQQYEVVLLNHCHQVAPALSLLPDATAVIPVIHNHHKQVYDVACLNWQAWDIAIGVSERISSEMRTRVPKRTIRTIHYGVELPTAHEWSSRARLGAEFKMLYIGRLAHEQKGIFFLPEILAGVRAQGVNATLTVVGEGPDKQQLQRRLTEMCQLGTFVVLPTQISAEIYRLLLGHHVLLMPSFYEGLPIMLLEAQACGCVPIASNLPGVTDVPIEHGKTGFLCPVADVSAFVTACALVASTLGPWDALSRAAHDQVVERFTTEIMAQKYLGLFAEVRAMGSANRKPRSKNRMLDTSVFGWRGFVPNRLRRAARSLSGKHRDFYLN